MMFTSEIFLEFGKSFFDAMHTFIDDDGIWFIHERFKEGLASFFHGKKSEIEILMTVDPTRDEC